MMHRTYTMITGASSGLGKEFALQCAQRGMNLILVALPGRSICSLAKALQANYKIDVRVYELDLTETSHVQKLAEETQREYAVDFLINNAGIGGTSAITEAPSEYLDKIIRVNVQSTSMLIHRMIPVLAKNKSSFILNVSSMAAFTPIAFKTVYPASKAFISSFSLGLREELADRGISVSVLYPGPIMTNSDTTRRIIAQGVKARLGLLPPSLIVSQALEKTFKGQAIIIPGRINRLNKLLLSLLPLHIKLKVISGAVKKEIKQSPFTKQNAYE